MIVLSSILITIGCTMAYIAIHLDNRHFTARLVLFGLTIVLFQALYIAGFFHGQSI